MHSTFLFAIEVVAALVVLVRTIYLASKLGWKDWNGHPLQFIGISIAYPLLMGGAVGIVIDRYVGHVLLLIGVMFLILSERRKRP